MSFDAVLSSLTLTQAELPLLHIEISFSSEHQNNLENLNRNKLVLAVPPFEIPLFLPHGSLNCHMAIYDMTIVVGKLRINCH